MRNQLFEQMLSGCIVMEVIRDDTGLAVDHRLIDANPQFEALTGLKRETEIGKTSRELSFGWPDDVLKRYYDIAVNGGSLRWERYNDSLNRHYDVQAFSPQKGYFVIIFNDISTFKNTEAALRASEEKYRSIFENSTEGVFQTTEDGRYISLNPSTARILGYTSPEEMMAMTDGLSVKLYRNPSDRERIVTILKKDGHVENFEVQMRKKDNVSIWVSLTVRIVRDAEGRLAYFEGTLTDIEERKKAEKKLAHLNRELKAISECNQILVRATDEHPLLKDICRIICDDAGYRMAWVGYAEQDADKRVRPVAWAGTEEGYLAKVNITWADTESGQGPAGTAIRTGLSSCFQDFMTDPHAVLWREHALKRGYRACIALPLKDETAATFGALMIYSTEPNAFTPDEVRLLEELAGDLAFGITNLRNRLKRKQAENLLKESEEQFRVLAESSLVGIYILKDGRYAYVNPAMAGIFGYSVAEMIGMTPSEIVQPSDLGMVSENIQRRISGEIRTKQYEVRGRYKDGSTRDVEVYGTRMEMNGEPILVGTLIDITERKKADDKKRQLEAQLIQAQKMETIGRLAGGVAHDFNNMLMAIIGNAEIALERVDPATPLSSNLQEILTCALRSADLTRQLLGFARKQTIALKILNLNELVDNLVKMLQRLIGEDIHIDWRPSMKLWPVKMDPSQIDQILVNLSVNARDAITGVGTLTIETENVVFDESYCIDHAGVLPGEYVLMAVRDTGRGMEKEILEHLFEPFFTTKEVGKGTGLGLATVYGIVKQNNGFIDVYSEPDQGTVFKIYLPRTQIEEGLEKEKAQQKSLGGTETVLIVEDEVSILKLGKAILEHYGYKVFAARSPAEARTIAEQHQGPIHLLITDVVMPQMNGRDLVKIISITRPKIKTLYISGYSATIIGQHGVLDKGVHFLQKPFSTKTLAAKVREILE